MEANQEKVPEPKPESFIDIRTKEINALVDKVLGAKDRFEEGDLHEKLTKLWGGTKNKNQYRLKSLKGKSILGKGFTGHLKKHAFQSY